jgi:hypothetical protein
MRNKKIQTVGHKFNINNMLNKNGGPVTIKSLFVPEANTTKEIVEATRNTAIVVAVQKANELFGDKQALTIRDLNGSDMGYIHNIMTETSNRSANAWNVMGSGSFTIAAATVIAIYGVAISFVQGGNNTRIPITGIRIDVGGSRIAQWNVQGLDQIINASVTSPLTPKFGISLSPIIVSEYLTVTLYEYTRIATTIYDLLWLGVTVEKQGVTLNP